MGVGRRRREANRRSIIENLETTPATVAQPVASPEPDETLGHIDFDWRPLPLERANQGRSFRWLILGAALVLAALAILLVHGLGTFSDAQADERLSAYRTELGGLAEALDALEAVLPEVGPDHAAAFAAATDALQSVAAEALPGLPPFVPQGALGGVARAQDHILAMTDTARSISTDLDVAATFTEASETLFALPPLPVSVPEELVVPAGTAITIMQSETRATLASLDPAETFASYLGEVEEALGALPDWTDRYLLALRRGDTPAAEALVTEIQARRLLVEEELSVALATIAKGVEERIAALRVALSEAEALTTRG